MPCRTSRTRRRRPGIRCDDPDRPNAGHQRLVRADPQSSRNTGAAGSGTGPGCRVHQHRRGMRAALRRRAQGLGTAHRARRAAAASAGGAAARRPGGRALRRHSHRARAQRHSARQSRPVHRGPRPIARHDAAHAQPARVRASTRLAVEGWPSTPVDGVVRAHESASCCPWSVRPRSESIGGRNCGTGNLAASNRIETQR
jgi:hypothetical protein